MADDAERANLWAISMRSTLLAIGLQQFVARLITAAGDKLTDDAIAAALADAIVDLKNTDCSGPTLELQAVVFGHAVEDLKKFAQGAIQVGRNTRED